MSDYMDTLAGKQGQYSQSLRETQVAYAEALEPTLALITQGGTGILNIINSLIKQHPTLTTGMSTFAITLVATTVAVTALKKAKDAYANSAIKAMFATESFTAALKANPIFFIVSTITTVITAISMLCNAIRENEEAQTKLNEATERYEKIKNNTYDYKESNLAQLKSDKEAIEEQIALMEKVIDIQNQINEINARSKDESGTSPTGYWYSDEDLKKMDDLKEKLKDANKKFNRCKKKYK